MSGTLLLVTWEHKRDQTVCLAPNGSPVAAAARLPFYGWAASVLGNIHPETFKSRAAAVGFIEFDLRLVTQVILPSGGQIN